MPALSCKGLGAQADISEAKTLVEWDRVLDVLESRKLGETYVRTYRLADQCNSISHARLVHELEIRRHRRLANADTLDLGAHDKGMETNRSPRRLMAQG
jgi:hypothetical protein